MENLKKLFNFSGTISGTTFILRWVLSTFIQFPGGYLTGIGLASGHMGYAMMGLIIASVGIALQFSTLLKRSKSIFSNARGAYMFYFAYLIISISKGFVQGIDQTLDGFISITLLGMFAYAIFKNSGTPGVKHLG